MTDTQDSADVNTTAAAPAPALAPVTITSENEAEWMSKVHVYIRSIIDPVEDLGTITLKVIKNAIKRTFGPVVYSHFKPTLIQILTECSIERNRERAAAAATEATKPKTNDKATKQKKTKKKTTTKATKKKKKKKSKAVIGSSDDEASGDDADADADADDGQDGASDSGDDISEIDDSKKAKKTTNRKKLRKGGRLKRGKGGADANVDADGDGDGDGDGSDASVDDADMKSASDSDSDADPSVDMDSEQSESSGSDASEAEQEAVKGKKRKAAVMSATTKRKRKKEAVPGAPKKPLNGYMHFSADARGKIRQENPKWTLGEIGKELGRLWKEMDVEARAPYMEKVAQDKIRYARELEEFKESDPDGYAQLSAKRPKKRERKERTTTKKRRTPKPKDPNRVVDSDDSGGDDDEDDKPPKELTLFDRMQADLKAQARTNRARVEVSQDILNANARHLVERMRKAYETDLDSIKRKRPAFAKLKMLREVHVNVLKKNLTMTLLDARILDVLNDWMMPLPNGSLPTIKLREGVYAMLDLLITEGGDSEEYRDPLENSKIGLTVRNMILHPKETEKNKAFLQRMAAKWIRIINKTDTDYKNLEAYERGAAAHVARRQRTIMQAAVKERARYNSARVPQPAVHDFVARPSARMEDRDDLPERNNMRGRELTQREKLMRKMKKTKNSGLLAARSRPK
jgi:HMG (high mobility group) box